MENQQGDNLTIEQQQVILTGSFGDGFICKTKSNKSYYVTNCIHKDYLIYKIGLLKNLCTGHIREYINQGYKQNTIYSFNSIYSLGITQFNALSLEEKLKKFTDLGIALWFYDDGSLHHKNYFYNLNTHKFCQEVNEDILKPYFNTLGMYPKVLRDKKKDGRIFYYLHFSKHKGAFEISNILSKYYIECFKYKLWSSTTIQKWSKLQVELKSKGIEVSARKFTNLLNAMQDIV
jgi:hypothetical protein